MTEVWSPTKEHIPEENMAHVSLPGSNSWPLLLLRKVEIEQIQGLGTPVITEILLTSSLHRAVV